MKMATRRLRIYGWLLGIIWIYPGMGFAQETDPAVETEVSVSGSGKELDTSPESIIRQICGNQFEASATYEASLKKGKHIPEVSAVLLELKSECEKFAHQLLQQSLLSSPIECIPTYPFSLREVKNLDGTQGRCFNGDRYEPLRQLIRAHVDQVLVDRQTNVAFQRFELSLALCTEKSDWRNLIEAKSAFEKAIRKYPLFFSRNSERYSSLQDAISRTRRSLHKIKQAIAQNHLSTISCNHPEMKHLTQCFVGNVDGEPKADPKYENTPCFLWYLANKE